MDSDSLQTARNVLEIGVIIGTIIIGLWRIRAAMDRRDAELEKQAAVAEAERDSILKEIESFKSDLRREFGGNSGGMREAINRISVTVDRVDEKTNDLAVEVGELRGRFEQHMQRP